MTEAQELSRSILLVDDDVNFRRRLARAFQDRGLDVREAGDAAEAMAASRDDPPEMAVVDLRMPGPDGLEVVRGLLAVEPAMRVVVLTGYGSIATALKVVRLGAIHYLTKPAYPDEILAALEPKKGDAPAGTGASEAEAPSLARVEWEHIQRVLADCDGNISLAARRLGLHRRSLQRKLAKAPVRW